MRATQYDRETAQAFGIPVDRVYAGVFALGAMLAAIAAVLIVPISQAHYLMGRDPLLLVLHRRHHRRARLAARHASSRRS